MLTFTISKPHYDMQQMQHHNQDKCYMQNPFKQRGKFMRRNENDLVVKLSLQTSVSSCFIDNTHLQLASREAVTQRLQIEQTQEANVLMLPLNDSVRAQQTVHYNKKEHPVQKSNIAVSDAVLCLLPITDIITLVFWGLFSIYWFVYLF